MSKTLAQMSAEIRAVNIEKGWRPVDGSRDGRTFGDYLALLHSEISEALEAFRDNGLADATDPHNPYPDPPGDGRFPKPEGVGSELADVLIRLLDMCDVFGLTPFDMDMQLSNVAPMDVPDWVVSFGDHMDWLHKFAAKVCGDPRAASVQLLPLPHFLRALVTVAGKYGFDLDAEYTRKIAYNKTREFRHGGRHI